jgi:hypothetical protein
MLTPRFPRRGSLFFLSYSTPIGYRHCRDNVPASSLPSPMVSLLCFIENQNETGPCQDRLMVASSHLSASIDFSA